MKETLAFLPASPLATVRLRSLSEATAPSAVEGPRCWRWTPEGNTGGANVSAMHPMPVLADLRAILDADRST